MRVVHSLLFLLAAVLAAPGMVAARGGAPVQNYENVLAENSNGKPLTAEQVRKAIIAGASRARWAASTKLGNVVRLTYSRGNHVAVVEATYSAKSYSIHYADSTNLNYDQERSGGVIHPNYNKWVNSLRQAIDVALRAA